MKRLCKVYELNNTFYNLCFISAVCSLDTNNYKCEGEFSNHFSRLISCTIEQYSATGFLVNESYNVINFWVPVPIYFLLFFIQLGSTHCCYH